MKQILSQAELAAGVARLARQIEADYGQRPLSIAGVLNGSVVLVADLIRQLSLPIRLHFVQASSYRGSATTPQALQVAAGMLPELRGEDVLLVDDIFDTGHTLVGMIACLEQLRPASLRTAVLLRKAGRCEVDRQPDYVGFDIPNEFVVGYGLDYNGLFRNLPYLAALEDADLKRAHPA